MTVLIESAWQDLAAGLSKRRVWSALAAETIEESHRRTLLGPVWLLVNYLLYAGTFVVLFGSQAEGENYPAYVALGLLVWLFINESVSQGVGLFYREAPFISGTVLPLSVYVFRQCAQSTIRSGYALIGAVGILALSGPQLGAQWIASVPAVGLILVTAPAVVLLFAVAGVLLPDMRFIVEHLARLGIFLSPIFWFPSGGGQLRNLLYRWNPVTYYLEIVRLPIYRGDVPLTAWQIALGVSAVLWLVALLTFGRYRREVVFLL